MRLFSVCLLICCSISLFSQNLTTHWVSGGFGLSSINTPIRYNKITFQGNNQYETAGAKSFLSAYGGMLGYGVQIADRPELSIQSFAYFNADESVIHDNYRGLNGALFRVDHWEFQLCTQLYAPVFRRKKANLYFGVGLIYMLRKVKYTSDFRYFEDIDIIDFERKVKEQGTSWGIPFSLLFQIPLRDRWSIGIQINNNYYESGVRTLGLGFQANYQLGMFIKDDS